MCTMRPPTARDNYLAVSCFLLPASSHSGYMHERQELTACHMQQAVALQVSGNRK